MATILIGLDDTDNATSPGTGDLARRLAAECMGRGMPLVSVTRHQFLVDPRIPYTSHNSGACVAVGSANGAGAAWFAYDFVAERSAEGSDPGVCVVALGDVPTDVSEFGARAAEVVLTIDEAMDLADSAGIDLRPLGGTGQGVIGALGSVGLRAGGNSGRFIDMPGLRELPGRVEAGVFAELGIRLDHRDRRQAAPDDIYDTLGWVRPSLCDGTAVLPVEWDEQRHAWIPVERKRSRPLE